MAETDKDDLISIIEEEELTGEIPDVMPLMPVRDVVIFTDMLLPLFVGRKKSVRAVEEAVAKDSFLMLATQKEPGVEAPKPEDIFEVGTVGRILRMLKLPDGRLKALVQGVAKAKVERYTRKRSWYQVRVSLIEEPEMGEHDLETEAMMRNVRDYSEKILALRGEMSNDVTAILESIEEPGRLADLVASNLRLKLEESQMILELLDPLERLRKVNDLLSREVELSAMQAKIQSDVKDEISKSQRDYFLREQVRAIHKELGEMDDRAQEVEEYAQRIKKAKMPKEAKEEAEKQLRRLEQMHPEAA
ncbi:MAG: LON peptidase substrate-binding domain-containing protein, partial [Desulfococcaceae bacterium]